MKASSTLRASALALALLTLTGGAAWAVGDTFKIDSGPGTSESDCLNSGGSIVTDAGGTKICKLKATQSREPTN